MASTDVYCDNSVRYLSVENLIDLNCALIASQTPTEPIGVLNRGALESAQQSPSQHRWYEQCSDIVMLAAVLTCRLATNHPFLNANKRTASAAGIIFLSMNGVECTAPSEDLVTVMEGLVTKKYDQDQFADWLRYWSRPFDAAELNQSDE